MKLKINKKKMKLPQRFSRSRDDDDEESINRKVKKAGWMITDPAEHRRAQNEARVLQGRNRPPEIWFMDGDEKNLRFRDSGEEPVGFWRYQVEVDGRWQSFTMPEDGEVDLFRDELGLRPVLRYVYEVIDLTGYKDKKGQRHRNVARFWVINEKTNDQLQKIRRKKGPLDSYEIAVSRFGQKVATTYQLLPDMSSPMPREFRKIPRLTDDFAKYYAPLPEDEQRMIVKRAHVRSATDD